MKYIKILISIFIFCFGFIFGIIYKDIPNLNLDLNIRLFEPLNFLLTASIGVLIPFFIKRWIDDSRQVKNNLIDELKSSLKEVEIIKDKIKFCYTKKTISRSDKDEINILFEQADLKYYCFEQQIITAYNKSTKNLREEIHNKYIDYWKYTTGAELMSDRFKTINDVFYKRHNEYFAIFETVIKKAIIKIHRF